MSLFHCSWADRASVLMTMASADAARKAAAEYADGAAPSKVREVPPGAFVAEVVFEPEEVEDAADVDVLQVELAEHTADLLFEWEDDAAERCGSVGASPEDDSDVACSLPKGHDGKHDDGEGLVWK